MNMGSLTRARQAVLTEIRKLALSRVRSVATMETRSFMKVEKLMSTNIKTCSPHQTLADAAEIMWKHDCGCVPVVDANGRVAGMLTDRDICMSAYLKGTLLHTIPIQEAMSQHVLSCRPNDSIETAEALMRRAQVRRLPVSDASGRLLGVLSLNDIAIAAEREQKTRTPEIHLKDVALTLSAVSKQRAATA